MADKKGGRRLKDQEMAAMLKRLGIVRTTARCPICNRVVSVKGFYTHIATCRN